MITGNATQISGHFRPWRCHHREILGIFPYFPVQAIAISHRRGPSFSCSALTLFIRSRDGGRGGRPSDFTSPQLPKAPHPSSLKWPLLLLQKILHPIFPNIANTSPSWESCHLLKVKAKYIEATLFEVNYESSLVKTHGATKK